MAMTNFCTSIEQSKKLIELGIDINTADMCWEAIYVSPKDGIIEYADKPTIGYIKHCLPAWSLAALLKTIPVYLTKEDKTLRLQIDMGLDDFDIWYEEFGLVVSELDCISEDFVDACVEMIDKLHKEELL